MHSSPRLENLNILETKIWRVSDPVGFGNFGRIHFRPEHNPNESSFRIYIIYNKENKSEYYIRSGSETLIILQKVHIFITFCG